MYVLYFFSFGHCVVCSSSIYYDCPVWYLQTLLCIIGVISFQDKICIRSKIHVL
jgi:hypothetical protein